MVWRTGSWNAITSHDAGRMSTSHHQNMHWTCFKRCNTDPPSGGMATIAENMMQRVWTRYVKWNVALACFSFLSGEIQHNRLISWAAFTPSEARRDKAEWGKLCESFWFFSRLHCTRRVESNQHSMTPLISSRMDPFFSRWSTCIVKDSSLMRSFPRKDLDSPQKNIKSPEPEEQ